MSVAHLVVRHIVHDGGELLEGVQVLAHPDKGQPDVAHDLVPDLLCSGRDLCSRGAHGWCGEAGEICAAGQCMKSGKRINNPWLAVHFRVFRVPGQVLRLPLSRAELSTTHSTLLKPAALECS